MNIFKMFIYYILFSIFTWLSWFKKIFIKSKILLYLE